MGNIDDFVLDVHNVHQKNKVKTIGQKLKSMIIDRKEEKLENGNIKLTLILDPKIGELKNV